jgi:hypothetical protein
MTVVVDAKGAGGNSKRLVHLAARKYSPHADCREEIRTHAKR